MKPLRVFAPLRELYKVCDCETSLRFCVRFFTPVAEKVSRHPRKELATIAITAGFSLFFEFLAGYYRFEEGMDGFREGVCHCNFAPCEAVLEIFAQQKPAFFFCRYGKDHLASLLLSELYGVPPEPEPELEHRRVEESLITSLANLQRRSSPTPSA